MKIIFCLGTRPEVIKMSELIKKCSLLFDCKVILTSQHTDLLDSVLDLLPKIDFKLNIPDQRSLEQFVSLTLPQIENVLNKEQPDLMIVQGDTASTFCGALCAFLQGVKVGHIEAGIRTFDVSSPFPEEFIRYSIAKMATYHWCPSKRSVENLINEKVHGEIVFTGNTINDYLNTLNLPVSTGNQVIVTLHRRENKDKFASLFEQISFCAKKYSNLNFTLFTHSNPLVKQHLDKLNDVNIIKPAPYKDMIKLISKCAFVITDSGGIQEECIFFNKKAIISRSKTERPEIEEIGLGKLTYDILNNIDWALEAPNKLYKNPYDAGNACDNIIRSISK